MTFLFSLLLTVITSTLHIDQDFSVTAAADEYELGRIPIVCNQQGDYTVQLVYRALAGQDLESLDKPKIEAQLQEIAEQVNYIFWVDSDSYTVGRMPRWKTTEDCRLDINYLASNAGAPTLTKTKQVIIEKRFDFCGLATVFGDLRPGAENAHNGSSNAWISTNCLNPFIVAHELLHSFGAVLDEAPHYDGTNHATEDGDLMRPVINPYCHGWITVDCGKDDYWSVRQPLPYWNTADSLFLIHSAKYTYILPLMMRH